jgi:hypothetical protein
MNLELYKVIIPELVFNSRHMNISYESHCNILGAIEMEDPSAVDKYIDEAAAR